MSSFIEIKDLHFSYVNEKMKRRIKYGTHSEEIRF